MIMEGKRKAIIFLNVICFIKKVLIESSETKKNSICNQIYLFFQ